MADIFDGDPFLVIDGDGADFIFKGGQPVMDQGLENHVAIALTTVPGWWGNDIEPVASRKIESQYMIESHKPITRQQLIDISRAAENDVSGEEFELVAAVTNNPVSNQLNTEILYTPVSRNPEILRLTKSGLSWLFQKSNPAHKIS